MSIFSKIGEFFKNILFPKFKTFLNNVFTKEVSSIMADIQDIVTKNVKELSMEDLTNSQKRTEAYKRIVDELKSYGKEARESVIRATIELAVLELKQLTGDK